MGKPQKHNKTVRYVIFINFLKLNSQCEKVKKNINAVQPVNKKCQRLIDMHMVI